MIEHGLRIISDPRWVVALPGQDVAAEARRQIGADTIGEDAANVDLVAAVSSMLQSALDDGAWWTAALVLAEGPSAVVVRTTLEWSGAADTPVTANEIFDVLIDDSRDADYEAFLALVTTQLGVGVRHQQVLAYSDGTLGDYLGFSIPYASGVLTMQTFSTRTGWAEAFGPMVEAMLLSLAPDAARSFGEVTLLAYVLACDQT